MKKDLINKFEEVLNNRKQEILSEISDFAKLNADGEYEVIHKDYGTSEDENSEEITDTMEDEMTLEHLTQELDNIEKALEKVREGNYGQCSKCGQEIEENRLKYNPAAIYCSSCQTKIEKDIL